MTSATRSAPTRTDILDLPSDTTLRFTVLIAATLGASLFIGYALYLAVRGSNLGAVLTQCAADAGARPDNADALRAWLRLLDRCAEPERLKMLAWSAAPAVALILCAATIYAVLPAWKLHARNFRPGRGNVGILAAVASLSDAAGLAGGGPRVVFDPLDQSCAGLVFGGAGRRYLALPGGLVHLFRVDPASFRAIVLHELAHLRNGDVGKTYFALAVWLAFPVTALIPFAVTVAWKGDWEFGLAAGWRVVVLTVVVYLARNAMLRSRELYADARACSVDPNGALPSVLGRLKQPLRWRTMIGLHPTPHARLCAIARPELILRFSVGDAIAGGLAASIVCTCLAAWLSLLPHARPIVPWLAGLACSPLLIGVVGVVVSRQSAVCAGSAAERRFRAAVLGSGAAIGFLIGETLSLFSSPTTLAPVAPWSAPGAEPTAHIQFGLIWSFLLVASCMAVLSWVAAISPAWTDIHQPRIPWLRSTHLTILVTAGVLAVWLGAMFAARDASPLLKVIDVLPPTRSAVAANFWIGPPALWLLMHPLVVNLVMQPLILTTLVLLWAYPLLTNRHRRSRRGAIRRVLRLAFSGGLAFLVLVMVLRVTVHTTLPPDRRGLAAFATAFYLWQLLLGIVIQLAIVVIVTTRAPEPSVAYALLAAFLVAVLAAAGLFASFTLAPCAPLFTVSPMPATCGFHPQAAFIWTAFMQFAVQGGLLALPTALLTEGVVTSKSGRPTGRYRPFTRSHTSNSGRDQPPPNVPKPAATSSPGPPRSNTKGYPDAHAIQVAQPAPTAHTDFINPSGNYLQQDLWSGPKPS